jgi:hypothetical protein
VKGRGERERALPQLIGSARRQRGDRRFERSERTFDARAVRQLGPLDTKQRIDTETRIDDVKDGDVGGSRRITTEPCLDSPIHLERVLVRARLEIGASVKQLRGRGVVIGQSAFESRTSFSFAVLNGPHRVLGSARGAIEPTASRLHVAPRSDSAFRYRPRRTEP